MRTAKVAKFKRVLIREIKTEADLATLLRQLIPVSEKVSRPRVSSLIRSAVTYRENRRVHG